MCSYTCLPCEFQASAAFTRGQTNVDVDCLIVDFESLLQKEISLSLYIR